MQPCSRRHAAASSFTLRCTLHAAPVHVIENVRNGHAVARGDGARVGEMLSAAAAVAAEGFERLMHNRWRRIRFNSNNKGANTTNDHNSSGNHCTLCTFARLCALVFGGRTMPVIGIPRADDTTSHSSAPCTPTVTQCRCANTASRTGPVQMNSAAARESAAVGPARVCSPRSAPNVPAMPPAANTQPFHT